MPRQVPRSAFVGISPTQFRRLNRILAEQDLGAMVAYDLGNRAGLAYDCALAVLLALYDHGLAKARWVVFHDCSEASIGSHDFKKGLPRYPRFCPECEEATSASEFSYDVRFVITAVVEFT